MKKIYRFKRTILILHITAHALLPAVDQQQADSVPEYKPVSLMALFKNMRQESYCVKEVALSDLLNEYMAQKTLLITIINIQELVIKSL